MSIYENVLKPITKQDYLDEALAAAEFVDTRRTVTDHGVYWDLRDARTFLPVCNDEISMYSGNSGIMHFMLSLYRVTKDARWLQEAKEGGEYVAWRWKNQRALSKAFSPYAYSTGYCGAAMVLFELAETAGDRKYADTAADILDTCMKDAKPVTGEGRQGYTWCTYPGIVGDAGTILTLLEAGKKHHRQDWVDFAIQAGRRYLTEQRTYPDGGKYYLGVDPAYFGGGDDYVDPNYPMGTGGIGYLLLRLYEESGDKAFLKANDGILDFHKAVALQNEDKTAALLPHGLPTKPDLYYLNYCHGPAGLARYYYYYNKVTGDPEYKEWEHKLANGILEAGAPEIHSRGYWHIHCFCCGTAGILNTFLGMWAAGEGREYLRDAERCGRQLLGWAIHGKTEDGKTTAMWYQAFANKAQSQTNSNIGLYDGIAGIGWAMLQLYTALNGEFSVARSVDDPYPDHCI